MPFEGESLLTLAEAIELLPRPVSRQTIWLWVRDGIHGVKLETLRVGRNHYTSREAVARFIAAQNGGTK